MFLAGGCPAFAAQFTRFRYLKR